MMTNNFLDIQNLSCRFGDFTAVDDVSFFLEQGEAFALLGASGCGKTTILRAIAGLEQPTAGKIQYSGRDLFAAGVNIPSHKRHIGFIFQDYAVFPHLSVRDNILFAIEDKSKRESKLKHMLELLQLGDQQHKMPQQLSGGQLQRVAIARTLAAAPGLILMDEPFSNLDAQLSRQLRSEIREIFKREGITSILVSHDQEEAFSYADRIAVMQAGKILQLDTPSEIYTQPQSAEVAAFFGHCQFIEGKASGKSASTSLGEVSLLKECLGTVKILIRPENLQLSADAQGNYNVESLRFLGEKKELTLRRGDTLLYANSGPSCTLKSGDKVRVSTLAPAPAYSE